MKNGCHRLHSPFIYGIIRPPFINLWANSFMVLAGVVLFSRASISINQRTVSHGCRPQGTDITPDLPSRDPIRPDMTF